MHDDADRGNDRPDPTVGDPRVGIPVRAALLSAAALDHVRHEPVAAVRMRAMIERAPAPTGTTELTAWDTLP